MWLFGLTELAEYLPVVGCAEHVGGGAPTTYAQLLAGYGSHVVPTRLQMVQRVSHRKTCRTLCPIFRQSPIQV